ncbi:hypothetical protein GCM10023350_06530 [Nocardioides endophyticus]|uniref:DUF1801 domain-containing protein n=1 Tax=Nocardioides endophyticus TaxID=1353775 RepID=A0ABP8YDW1_9ACTN
MPAYARDGKVLCFFQPAEKFEARYATFGFNDLAQLDDGAIWPTAYAVTDLSDADVQKFEELVRKAVGDTRTRPGWPMSGGPSPGRY